MSSLFASILNDLVSKLNGLSEDRDVNENIGELVLESLLSSDINSITELRLGSNKSWFRHPVTKERKSGNIVLLEGLLQKLAGL